MSASIRFCGTKRPGLAQSPRQIRRTRSMNLSRLEIFHNNIVAYRQEFKERTEQDSM